jgi:hypothetical protein
VARLGMSQSEALLLQECAWSNSMYWNMDDEGEGRMIMSVKSDDNRLSEKILKKLVGERRKKQLILDEVIPLAKNLRQFIE